MTNKELSTEIRNKIKENGYNLKDFSIKTRYCGYSSSCNITIKNLKIRDFEIEKIVKRFNDYEYDISGDILEGGNTYIFVEYDHNTMREYEEQFHEKFLKEFEENKKVAEQEQTPNRLFTLFDDEEYHTHATYSTVFNNGNCPTIYLTVGGEHKHYNANKGYGLAEIYARYTLGHYNTIKEISYNNFITQVPLDDNDKEWINEKFKDYKKWNKEFTQEFYKFIYYKNFAIKIE